MKPVTGSVEEFDEEWYLKTNTDIITQENGGPWVSGLDHYLRHGRLEGRLPREGANTDQPLQFGLEGVVEQNFGAGFLAPTELARTETKIRRVAMVGSCLLEAWNFHKHNPSNCPVDLIVMNNVGQLPEHPAEGFGLSDYDFQVVQLPLRHILHDTTLAKLPHGSPKAQKLAFDEAAARLALFLDCRMEWNKRFGLLTFVGNFFIPQRNPMGRLFPKYDLSNPEYFIFRLNQELERLIGKYNNAYMLDLDALSASIGRRYSQDDTIYHASHGALLQLPGIDYSRMEVIAPFDSYYEVSWWKELPKIIWAELLAMYRTIQQTDSVKLVVVDLDDTLWRGISGDIEDPGTIDTEGWPIGFVEALLYLKKRGILIAIISKNEETRIRDIWRKIFYGRIDLEDFAVIKINWLSKTDNMRELLQEVNLLPQSVVFIDDNPVERAGMASAFPQMRIMGRHPYYFRRTLLWAPETQIATLTDESARRTEMIHAQLERESTRKTITREEFLQKAAPKLSMMTIETIEHPRFTRAFELINKTNQFNTTGKRWKVEDCERFFHSGGTLYAYEVSDAYTDYGLVGGVLTKDQMIEQWVMSCRILGYQIEIMVMAIVIAALRQSHDGPIMGRLINTATNFPCRDLFQNCGFTRDDAIWALNSETPITAPKHITVQTL
jgi:FkbH-like protein